MHIDCVTFDLDDTLWECGSVLARAEEMFYAWVAVHHPSVARSHTLDSLVTHRREYFARYPELHHDLTRLRKRWLTHLAHAHRCAPDFVESGFRVFWEHRNAVTPFADAEPALSDVRASCTIGAITNGNADVHHIGIGHWFDFVVTAADAGAAKPAATIFEVALQAAGVAAARAVHVGDDPERDVLGARAVGMRTVWINSRRVEWPGEEAPPDVTIATLAELGTALDALRNAG